MRCGRPIWNAARLDRSTTTQSPPTPLAVLLVGNYPRDGQESMRRFASVMLEGLRKEGVATELVLPPVWLGRAGKSTLGGIGKWLAYVDKFALFPLLLRRRVRQAARHGRPLVVHLCDHSNSMYASAAAGVPVVTTCHDLLAVRGALGEATDCPASPAGRYLQRWILRGLARSTVIASVSAATQADVDRLLPGGPISCTVSNCLNHPYRVLTRAETDTRLAPLAALRGPFALHVGSNLRRKNREGVLRIFARTAGRWSGQLAFAGQPLSAELRALAASLGIADRIVEVPKPDNDLLEALYNRAVALIFPSRFEGFGWPIIEAQACGCPVLTTRSGPMPEVAGGAALLRDVDDEEGFARDLVTLTDPAQRELWSRRGLENAQRYTTERMVLEYLRVYRQAVAAR